MKKLKKCSFSSFFQNLTKKLSSFWLKIFGIVVKHAFYGSRWSIWWTFDLEKTIWFFNISGFWAKIFRPIGKFFWQGLQNCISRVQGNSLKMKQFLEKFLTFLSFADIELKRFGLFWKFWSMFAKISFYLSGWKFWGKKCGPGKEWCFYLFPNSERKFLLVEVSGQACGYFIWRVQRRKNWGQFFLKKSSKSFLDCE